MTRTIATAACLLVACALSGAAAAQEPARASAVAVVDGPPHVQPAAERDDDAVCSRARRRLWIEGEGWIVRRITTCR